MRKVKPIPEIVKELTFYEKLSIWLNAQSAEHVASLGVSFSRESLVPPHPEASPLIADKGSLEIQP